MKSTTRARWLNRLTPSKASRDGIHGSSWRNAWLPVKGGDECMQYEGLERELGERLRNLSFQSQRVRYQTICLHLDHKRGYSKQEIWPRHNAIRADVCQSERSWTPFGIEPAEERID